MTTRKPTSPGEILYLEFLEPLGLTQAHIARHIGCDVKTINRLVRGHTRMRPEMAARLAGALGTSIEFWLNLQQALDVYEARHTVDIPAQITAA